MEDAIVSTRNLLLVWSLIVFACASVAAQTGNTKHFAKDGLSFDYPAGWTLEDASDGDAQKLKLSRADGDIQLAVFVHRGHITEEKMADAHKTFIDPYVTTYPQQFPGAKVERTADTTEIAGLNAEGTRLKMSFGSDSATAQIYWALVNGRVVVLTFFGPDADRKKFASSWDMLRNTLKIEEAKPAAPKPSPTPK